MQVTKLDKSNADNLIKILRRAKLELDGAEEILATAEVLKWMGALNNRIEKDLKEQDEAAKAMEAIVSAKLVVPEPVIETPTPKAKKEKVKKAE